VASVTETKIVVIHEQGLLKRAECVLGIKPIEHRIPNFQGFFRQIIGFTRQTMGWFRQSMG